MAALPARLTTAIYCLLFAAAATDLAHAQPGTRAGARTSSDTGRRDILNTEKSLFSRASEELIIRDFFQDRRGGVFLDVGCWHPITASNTYYLEHHLGWSGIGIDALNEMAPQWKRSRPASRFLNFVVTDRAGALIPFYRVALTDISSVDKPATGPAGRPIASKAIMVPTITLTKALDDNGVSHVDFVSMDIEGAELPALAGFDIERFRPQLLCVESKVKNRDRLLVYFASHGYHRLDRYLTHDKTNWYFSPSRSPR